MPGHMLEIFVWLTCAARFIWFGEKETGAICVDRDGRDGKRIHVCAVCGAAEGFGRVTTRPGSPKATGAVAWL
jgi:hypothetical protein